MKSVTSSYDGPELDEGEERQLARIVDQLVGEEKARREAESASRDVWESWERLRVERERQRGQEWEWAEDRAREIVLASEDGILLGEYASEPDKVQVFLRQLLEHETYVTVMSLVSQGDYFLRLTPKGRAAGLARKKGRDA